ncbi:unnamed protein product [Parnassius apollo]|uniref:(apollo) hypothetical protein n=1 Tax=Parnassius apollo TaxID=110799 RepID=A0A8S3WP79_PARAO|nr:unnamed protein product [Parnassius apollo]
MGHLSEIPKRFEIKGGNAAEAEFKKYLNDISDLAKKANVTVKYKVKVEVSKPQKKRFPRKEWTSKAKSKKYNVPLKKKNIKLSNLEIMLRKHLETIASKVSNDEDHVQATTEKNRQVFTTKQNWYGKYKPLISHVRTNYTKIIKPVRKKVITLTV